MGPEEVETAGKVGSYLVGLGGTGVLTAVTWLWLTGKIVTRGEMDRCKSDAKAATELALALARELTVETKKAADARIEELARVSALQISEWREIALRGIKSNERLAGVQEKQQRLSGGSQEQER